MHKNSALFPSYIKVQKGVLKNIKKVGNKEQKNNLTTEYNRFRLFYIPKTKRNKPKNPKKRKPSLRRSFFLPPFLSQRKSLTNRYKKFFYFLPPVIYKKKGIRKTLWSKKSRFHSKWRLKNPKFVSKRLMYSRFFRKIRKKEGLIRELFSFALRSSNFGPYQKFQKKRPFIFRAIQYFYKKFRRSRYSSARKWITRTKKRNHFFRSRTPWKHFNRLLKLRVGNQRIKQKFSAIHRRHRSNNKNFMVAQVHSNANVRTKFFSLFSRKINWLGKTKRPPSKRTSQHKTTKIITPTKSISLDYKFQNPYPNPRPHVSLLPAKAIKKSIPITPKADIRSFSTWSAVPAKKRLHFSHSPPKRLPRGWKTDYHFIAKYVKTKGHLTVLRQITRRDKRNRRFGRITGSHKARRSKRYPFKRWKWRFPRWKNFPRLRMDAPANQWAGSDLFPYRLYRRPQQPYRRRKPWEQKKHKRLRLIRQKSKWGRLLRRSEFITLQNRYFQVYSQFYGLASLTQLRAQNLHFRRSAIARHPKLSLALTHFNQQLDVSLCRLHLAPTLQIARLLIRQGYIRVNGEQIWTPRKKVQVWDLVQITAESDYFFGKYWYSRNKYQRYLYRQPQGRFKNVHPQKVVLSFGFFTRHSRITDLPRHDRLSWREFGRLLLI